MLYVGSITYNIYLLHIILMKLILSIAYSAQKIDMIYLVDIMYVTNIINTMYTASMIYDICIASAMPATSWQVWR
jgi:peptidoglycan/LPS O-acetylase OafA/YrhL